jgi:hypothetical protein
MDSIVLYFQIFIRTLHLDVTRNHRVKKDAVQRAYDDWISKLQFSKAPEMISEISELAGISEIAMTRS